MKQTFVKSHFKDKIPRTTAAPVLGVYEEESDLNILGSPESEVVKNTEPLDVCDIAKFVHSTITELHRLDSLYGVSKVSFDLDIKGNKIRFTVDQQTIPSNIPTS